MEIEIENEIETEINKRDDEIGKKEPSKTTEKKRIRLTVAYDGTNYSGWQLQPNGITIEEVLNRELTRLLGEEIKVIGASRTDAGVHAMGNIAVFDTVTRIPAEKISYAMNTRLPEDIRIRKSEEVALDFHPRHCNSEKTYEYMIWNHSFANPLLRLYSKFCYYFLDIPSMQKAADVLVGTHDFQSFCSAGSQAETTVRTVTGITVERDPKEPCIVRIRVKGKGFLYNMVRIISGTLLEIGMGLRKAEEMEGILASCDRSKAGPTAEAKGLTLKEIRFLDEPENEDTKSMN
jgi:tRNA pseudouridine38-40 synthase